MPQTISLLEKLVNINSGSMNVAGVHASGELVRAELDKLGFATQWITMPDSVKNAGHLVATIKGKKGKKLLLLGHLDTVFEPDMPPNPYRVIDDSTATGQGILDDKGGVVVMLAALQAMAKAGTLKDNTITVYLTGDEELGGIPVNATRSAACPGFNAPRSFSTPINRAASEVMARSIWAAGMPASTKLSRKSRAT